MRFCFEHSVLLPRATVFAFFENPERLGLLHVGGPNLRLLHYERQVRVGAEAWIEVMVAGFVPMVLGFRHFVFEPPYRFGEQAVHGPFSRFVHIHEFVREGEKTVVRDLLEVSLSWPYGGAAMLRSWVVPTITRMFHDRAEALTRLVADGTVGRCSLRSAPQ